MFSNSRDIQTNDLVMFHEIMNQTAWIGLVLSVDRRMATVRWYFPEKREWATKQQLSTSMLYLLGPLPEWAEVD